MYNLYSICSVFEMDSGHQDQNGMESDSRVLRQRQRARSAPGDSASKPAVHSFPRKSNGGGGADYDEDASSTASLEVDVLADSGVTRYGAFNFFRLRSVLWGCAVCIFMPQPVRFAARPLGFCVMCIIRVNLQPRRRHQLQC